MAKLFDTIAGGMAWALVAGLSDLATCFAIGMKVRHWPMHT